MAALQKGLFVYPWNMAEEGIEESVELYKSVNTDTLFVSASYHSGRFFHPKATNKMHTRHDSGTSFQPDLPLYPSDLQPQVDADLCSDPIHQQIRETCDKNGISYNSWIVGMHNSTLGRSNLELCVENAYGEKYDYALCPSQPTVRKYLAALVEDVLKNLKPESVLLETPNFLGFIHDHHHELILANLGPVCEYLLSLCFCEHCQDKAAKDGIDSDLLRHRIKERINFLIENERGGVSAEFSNAELASILLEDPNLYEYSRMRLKSVTSFIKEIRSLTNSYGKMLYAVPSIFARPASRAWMEGTSLSEVAKAADGIFLLSYFSDPALVRADIEWVKLFIGDTPIFSAFNGGYPDTLSEEGLKACIKVAMDYQPFGLGIYNASLLTNTRMKWVQSVYKMVDEMN
ncbi:hypothetical protein [Aquibacillus saliphilus]|uniref:hypothetical protein n=1 Tax=Aquibacillus saliphilus TaxID=1909422 RepID=UPI001CF084C7|nr:hypothetical protein [Aquibacillus saliphilus]